MIPEKKTARLAGAVYLVIIVSGIFILGYVPDKLINWKSPSVTYNNIVTHQILYRLSILGDVICYTAFLILPLVLYRLLKQVNKTMALLMVILAAVSIPISFVNILNKFAVLSFTGGANYLNVFDTEKLQAQTLLYLHFYNDGNQIASVFWGLWLFPFGYLMYRSGFVPKILGVLIMAGCFGYLIAFTGWLFYPHYNQLAISSYISLPASAGEICTCLWLLIFGVKSKYISATNPSV
ncbi:DUF4386 domain-containing protein [Mucilaginibacter segetis]|uniref:DUF4386 domain-containing protein n=1 Tax=Mucilaginibacter segetis TaxID=2793071 RepID=A0A934PWR4_9SPHI|nr:DUF4386 domain-containing protein [Mucilaginibacter segetis]MBK0380570.1 DUF4386 domain-containing protein [Mucilaginibacter segetis]